MKQKFFVRTINKKGIRLSPIPFFEAVMAEKSVSKSIKSLSCAPFSDGFYFSLFNSELKESKETCNLLGEACPESDEVGGHL